MCGTHCLLHALQLGIVGVVPGTSLHLTSVIYCVLHKCVLSRDVCCVCNEEQIKTE